MGRRPKPESLLRMQNPSLLATYLDKLCRERNISLRAASLAAGLGEATLGNIVRGYRRPDPTTLKKVALYFDVSEDALLEMAGHRSPPGNSQHNEIADPELRMYLASERINNLPTRDQNYLKVVMRHLLNVD